MNFLRDLHVLVLGLGESGLAMTRWCVRHGATVRVWDSRENPPHADALRDELPDVELFAGELPARADLTIFVAHPCHPPIFNDETDLEAKRDHFGGVKAKQGIVCALLRGPDAHYALAEDVAKRMCAPVMRSHRATVEQMAILEPVLSETICATCLTVIREATDEAVRRGVPKEVAHDFILGHLNVELAILFDQMPGVRMSDAANRAVEIAKKEIFAPDWKKVFEREAIEKSIRMITHVDA